MASLFTTDRLFHLRLSGPPVAQPRHSVGIGRGGYPRAYIPDGHPVHDYKGFVRSMARRKWNWPPLEGPLESQVLFVSETEGRGRWKDTKPDLDNYIKALWDALAGIVYVGDGQIAASREWKRFRFPWEKPFVEVLIRKIDRDVTCPTQLFRD